MNDQTLARYKMSRAEAFKQGFTIDSHCYPNIAYKGGRMQPNEWFEVPTEVEEPFYLVARHVSQRLLAATKAILEFKVVIQKIDWNSILEQTVEGDDESTAE